MPSDPLLELDDTCWQLVAFGDFPDTGAPEWVDDPAQPECAFTTCFEPDGLLTAESACRSCVGEWLDGESYVRLLRIDCAGDACGCATPPVDFQVDHQFLVRTEDAMVLWDGPHHWSFVRIH